MAEPEDRKVIWGTHVVPQVSFTAGNSETREEGSTVGISNYTDYKLDTTVAKRFGGKGSVTINTDQGDDGWVSFMGPVDDVWESRSESDDKWEDTYTVWDRGGLNVGPASDAAFPAVLRGDSATIDFLYVKNTGSVRCELALEGNEFDILIPAGAAVSMRLNSVSSDDIKVQTASSTTTIEYVIAKTP